MLKTGPFTVTYSVGDLVLVEVRACSSRGRCSGPCFHASRARRSRRRRRRRGSGSAPASAKALASLRVDARRLAHHRHDVVVAVLPLGELADDLEEVSSTPGSARGPSPSSPRTPAGSSARKRMARLHREQLEVGRVDGEPLVGGLVGAGDVHVAQREPGADEVRRRRGSGSPSSAWRTSLSAASKSMAFSSLTRAINTWASGSRGASLSASFTHCAGVAGVVLVEEELGPGEERLDALLARRALLGRR